LEYVADKIREMSTRELYGIIPFRVHEYYIDRFVKKWDTICLGNFVEIERILRAAVSALCEEHFHRFQSSGMYLEAS